MNYMVGADIMADIMADITAGIMAGITVGMEYMEISVYGVAHTIHFGTQDGAGITTTIHIGEATTTTHLTEEGADTTKDRIQHIEQTTLLDHIDHLATQVTDIEIAPQTERVTIEVHLTLETHIVVVQHQQEIHIAEGLQVEAHL